jgi:hypothetical protein
MKWDALTLNLIFVTTVVIAHPAIGMAQTARENAEARRLFSEGERFLYAGNYVESEKKFREALTKYPKAEQADRTAFYLVDSLVKLRRVQEARTEIENFRKNYPGSRWTSDVNEKILVLGGQLGNPADVNIWNSPAELRQAQARADLGLGTRTPDGPRNKIYPREFPTNPSMNAELLRQIVSLDGDAGIEEAREMLKFDPSDPAVAANLGNIANSDSPQVLPFLLSVWGNVAANPNMRQNAMFWFARMNPDKEVVAKHIMDLLSRRETQSIGSTALYRMTVADHRAVLERIVNSSNPEKFALMDKIYQNGSAYLKSDLLMLVGMLNDSRSVPFIMDHAQNERDASVRSAAAQALRGRKDVDLAMLQKLLRAAPPAPRGRQTDRFVESPAIGSGPGSGVVPLSTLPVFPQ